MNFDNDKQRKTVKIIAKRLAKGPIYTQQLRTLLENKSPYADDRSYENIINQVKSDPSIPIKKKGSKFVRTDISDKGVSQ